MSTAKDNLAASDGKHYWNCWTMNYIRHEGGFITHAFCEEDKTTRALCGVKQFDGGGLSVPSETKPGCLRCEAILKKRGVIQ